MAQIDAGGGLRARSCLGDVARRGCSYNSDVVRLRLDGLAAIDLEALAPGGANFGPRIEELRDAREFLEEGRHAIAEVDRARRRGRRATGR